MEIQKYWKTNIKVMVTLLTIWATVSFGCSILFVEKLNTFTIGGFPVGFWFAQQGAIYVFVILIFAYFFIMEKVDRDHEVND
ncbi:MAG: DUF4212 domain-containing protein [Thermodesulfobacteriota bacterium]